MQLVEKLTLSPLLSALPGLHHGFTNLSLSKEELSLLDSSTSTAHQVHGDKLIWVDSFEKRARQADAVATFHPGVAVGAHSADCTPILFAAIHPATNKVYAVMAVHAGWRGTALGIAEKAFSEFAREALKRHQARFVAAIGPCISLDSFEVGPEVVAAFPGSESRGIARFLRMEGELRKYLFDLPAENLRQLGGSAESLGVKLDVESLGLCTLKLQSLFPSYRRDKGNNGRILSFLRFEP